MAKVRNNIITQGLSGMLGDQIVFRAGKGGRTIVATKPAYNSNRILSASQQAHMDAFRQAIAYAKSAKDNDVYINKVKGTALNSYNAAIVDWFSQPKILEVDGENWTGEVGQVIRVKAYDDTFVAKVHLAFIDDGDNVLEEGDAVQADGLWWEYTTQTQVSFAVNPHIVVTVEDLPSNIATLSWAKN